MEADYVAERCAYRGSMTELISSFAGAAKASKGAVAAPPAPAAEACESHWLVGPAPSP